MARQARMRGYDVLHPIGFDAFGLPAENAAIKHNTQAAAWTYKNMDQALATMKRMGFSYDMDRLVKTCSPDYYRWGQWIFEKLWERGLVYRKKNPVNWCPTCETVLANEQVTEGRCWRCDSEVEKRDLEQWYIKITEYAQELLDDLEKLPGWPERVKQMQANWIGRSEGAEVDFTLCDADGDPIPGDEGKITVFTTRADTLFGNTFFLLAPEYKGLMELVEGTEYERPSARSSRAPSTSLPSSAPRARSRSTARSRVVTLSTPSPGRRSPSGWPTTSSPITAPAPSWPFPVATSATSSSPRSTTYPSSPSSFPMKTRCSSSSKPSRVRLSRPSTGTRRLPARAPWCSPVSTPA